MQKPYKSGFSDTNGNPKFLNFFLATQSMTVFLALIACKMQYHLFCFSFTNEEHTWLRMFYLKTDTFSTLKLISLYLMTWSRSPSFSPSSPKFMVAPVNVNKGTLTWLHSTWAAGTPSSEQCSVPVSTTTSTPEGHGSSRVTVRELRGSPWVLCPWLHSKNQSLCTNLIPYPSLKVSTLQKATRHNSTSWGFEKPKTDPELVVRPVLQEGRWSEE